MKIGLDSHQYAKQRHAAMRKSRQHVWPIWRQIARTYLPYVHPWLMDGTKNEKVQLNEYYITSHGLRAARVQTAGLMNGITSPTRPWLKFQIGNDPSKLQLATRKWLYDAAAIVHQVLARSNYYNVMAMSYFDVGLMNISGMQIFEDTRDVVRAQRYSTGEFYVEFDNQGRLRSYSREMKMTVLDIKETFGEENMTPELREKLRNPQSSGAKETITHFVSRTLPGLPPYLDRREWKELYWLNSGAQPGDVLAATGYREQPAIFPRWSAELDYGVSPGMEALADMNELIQLILDKGIGIESMMKPPMLFDATLRNQPKSTVPGGHTYVPNLAQFVGAKPAFQLNVPVQELRADIMEVTKSIEETFHNPLFNMISQLDTVRSAAEIDARREEKLVQLSHFLERFENEALDPAVERVFNICLRDGLFPDPPQEVLENNIDIQYVSILTTAQRALNTVPMERLLAMVGNVVNVKPDVLDLIDFDEFTYQYGDSIGTNPTIFKEKEAVDQERASREQASAMAMGAQSAGVLTDAAKNLSETDVGGGANALQRLLG